MYTSKAGSPLDFTLYPLEHISIFIPIIFTNNSVISSHAVHTLLLVIFLAAKILEIYYNHPSSQKDTNECVEHSFISASTSVLQSRSFVPPDLSSVACAFVPPDLSSVACAFVPPDLSSVACAFVPPDLSSVACAFVPPDLSSVAPSRVAFPLLFNTSRLPSNQSKINSLASFLYSFHGFRTYRLPILHPGPHIRTMDHEVM
jgi:hypothetical protein